MSSTYEELQIRVAEQLPSAEAVSGVLEIMEEAYQLGRTMGRNEESLAARLPKQEEQLDLEEYAEAEQAARRAVAAAFSEPQLELEIKESA